MTHTHTHTHTNRAKKGSILPYVLAFFTLFLNEIKASTLTISSSVTMEKTSPNRPTDLFPTFFTSGGGNYYIFTGSKIEITNGATVEIDDLNLRFDEDVFIEVNVGTQLLGNMAAFLALNNGSTDFWGGIKVFGTSSASQYLVLPFPYNPPGGSASGTLNLADFGHVSLWNNSYVENAILGIESIEGGIVQTENTFFKNCALSVYLGPYSHDYLIVSNNPMMATINQINACRFENTTFHRSKYMDWPLSALINYAMVFLQEANGINFHGCQFKHTRGYFSDQCIDRDYGIFAFASNFKLQNDGTGSIDPTTGCMAYSGSNANYFEGFYTGIFASDLGGNEEYTIVSENVEYNNCLNGMSVTGGKAHVIKGSAFSATGLEPSYFDVNQCASLIAFSFDKCEALVFYENTVTTDNTDGIPVNHLRITDARDYSTQVYRNVFTNLCLTGNCAISYDPNLDIVANFLATGTTANNKGVDIRCNNYSGFHYDWALMHCEVKGVFGEYIGPMNYKSAGNIFSTNSIIFDEQKNNVTYYWKASNSLEEPKPLNAGSDNSHFKKFTPNGNGGENTCPAWDCNQWPVGIANFEEKVSALLYPNPNKNEFKIQFSELNTDLIQSISYTDALGKSGLLKYDCSDNTCHIKHNLPKGIYFIRPLSNTNSVEFKILKLVVVE